MTAYDSTLTYLYGLQNRGVKLGLRNILALLASVGNPERVYPSIHVAGTNGKGSTSSLLASIFQEAGYRTGLYTSPHLIRFTERIRINGREIPEKRLVRYVEALRSAVEANRATFFETTTCVAFMYFADEGVDIAIVETGLGGRLDSTNVLTPLASVITSIALDHTRELGPTIQAIAREKGGIIKPGVPVVIGNLEETAEREIRSIARRKHAPLVRAGDVVRVLRALDSRVSFVAGGLKSSPVRLGLSGEHQTQNAALVCACVSVLLKRRVLPSSRFGRQTIRRGLENVRRNTRLGGRLARAGPGKRVILDVAHNPAGMRAAISSLLQNGSSNLSVVLGVMKDKDLRPMLREVAKVAGILLVVRPKISRARDIASILRIAQRLGIYAERGGTVASGVQKALRRPGAVLVTGSHYVVGEALVYLKKKA